MMRHILDPSPETPGSQRFVLCGETVEDLLTGLVWPRSANPLGFPVPWAEALDAVARLNREQFLGVADWRLPNRRELRSLIHHGTKQPALPQGYPFRDVFLGWYWSSTTKADLTAYAWNLHFEGGRMFYSRKDEFRLLWPVRGESLVLSQTGQTTCYGATGQPAACVGTGQDGAVRAGIPWPRPRFTRTTQGVLDRLTELCWLDPGLLSPELLSWQEALGFVAQIPGTGWRLPNINELESLVDAEQANPALPLELLTALSLPAAFSAEGFWSSTISGFDPAWAFVLYVQKGAVGVGFQAGREFHAWPVRDAAREE